VRGIRQLRKGSREIVHSGVKRRGSGECKETRLSRNKTSGTRGGVKRGKTRIKGGGRARDKVQKFPLPLKGGKTVKTERGNNGVKERPSLVVKRKSTWSVGGGKAKQGAATEVGCRKN